MATRAPRETESRAAEKRPATWEPPRNFVTPPDGNGRVYRWIRTAIKGEPDHKNWNRRTREGWVPVPLSEIPELSEGRDQTTRFSEFIEIDGMLLCWLPKDKADARKRRLAAFARQQMVSVNNNMMAMQDHRMPWVKPVMKSYVTTGGGKPPAREEAEEE
jgi:hypothetical protein